MNEKNRPIGWTLGLRCFIPAKRERVFDALTDPLTLAKWWGPNGFSCPSIEFEPRVGTTYRIAMQPPDGELFYLSGEFRRVSPPRQLAFTFVWDPPAPEDQETLAELSLDDEPSGTAITLTQGPFATEARRELHETGWSEGFERLRSLFDRQL